MQDAAPPPNVPTELRTCQRMVSFWEAVAACWFRWTIRGRASRSEYWWALLFNVMLYVCVDAGHTLLVRHAYGNDWVPIIMYIPFVIALIVAQLCLVTRRLHDSGRSGFWVLALIVVFLLEGLFLLTGVVIIGDASLGTEPPAVGQLFVFLALLFFLVRCGLGLTVFLIFPLFKSQPHPNRYGPIPNLLFSAPSDDRAQKC